MKEVFKALIVFIGIFIAVNAFLKFKNGINQTFKRMKDVSAYLQKKISKYNKEEVLIAIDIDLTLLQPDHPALYVPNVRKHLKIYRQIEKQYPNMDPTLPFAYSLLLPQHLVDEGIYALLEQFREIKKIAFTATFTGPFLDIQRLEQLRYEQLKEKNLSFEDSFSEKDFSLESCPSYRSTYPAYYKGVLCSNSERGTTTKGTVLCAFLKKLNWQPKCIVLIDDRTKNFEDVSKALKEHFPETKFIGIKYTGAHDYCPEKITKEAFQTYWADCFHKASLL